MITFWCGSIIASRRTLCPPIFTSTTDPTERPGQTSHTELSPFHTSSQEWVRRQPCLQGLQSCLATWRVFGANVYILRLCIIRPQIGFLARWSSLYTHNMYPFATWTPHNVFLRTTKFKIAAESLEWSSQKIGSKFPCGCLVIDHRWRQIRVRTKKWHTSPEASMSLFSPHFDVLSNLFLNRRTVTWNLFVLYAKEAKKLKVT